MNTNNKPLRITLTCVLCLVILAVQVLLLYFLWSTTAAVVCAVIEVPVLTWLGYEIVRAPIIDEDEEV